MGPFTSTSTRRRSKPEEVKEDDSGGAKVDFESDFQWGQNDQDDDNDVMNESQISVEE